MIAPLQWFTCISKASTMKLRPHLFDLMLLGQEHLTNKVGRSL